LRQNSDTGKQEEKAAYAVCLAQTLYHREQELARMECGFKYSSVLLKASRIPMLA
jgi:hypothetical protein